MYFFQTVHACSVVQSFEMETRVYKKIRDAFALGNAEAARFARGFTYVQYYLALVLTVRKGEDVRRVGFLAIVCV